MESELPKQMSPFSVQMLPSPSSSMMISQKRGRGWWLMAVELILRVLVILLSLAGAVTLANSDETVIAYGMPEKYSYTYSSACKFKLVADGLVCASTILSLALVYVFTRPKSNPNNYFYLFLHDLVMVIMMISGCAAATAIGYIGKYGQNQSEWQPICFRAPKFCDKVTLSMALSYFAFFCLFLLTIMAANTLKSISARST